MKHSDNSRYKIAAVLQIALPLLLLVPNVVMSAWSSMPWPAFVANLAAPLGVYLLLMAWSANAGRSAVMMLPFSILAAFQIVLLALYLDGSVIAVDMFLNVVTTNSSEAGELLGNLAGPVALVLLLYLPPLEAGVAAWLRRERTPSLLRRRCAAAGAALVVAGGVCMLVASVTLPRYRADREVFPVNAMCNLAEAVSRTVRTARYADTSAGFTFGATDECKSGSRRRIYMAVIGETSRADHYQIFGYDRFTTPLLCTVDSLVECPRVLSESNTTHKSVPMLLSTLSAAEFGDSIYHHKSVITAFREAGFHTVFLSMQNRNNSFIDFFGSEADTTIFLRESLGQQICDTDLLPAVDSLLAVADDSDPLLLVVHLYGSHFNYEDRYPRSEAYFLPDKASEANQTHRQRLVNAYDNSIRCTDRVLHGLITRLDSLDCPGGLIYTADHGEDIFDDERGRFLHASPTATFAQLHVPMMLYFNRSWRGENPDKWKCALSSCRQEISSSESFTPTLMHMAGISSPRLDRTSALTSEEFTPVATRLFVNDRNEAVDLQSAGFSHQDYDAMQNFGFRTGGLSGGGQEAQGEHGNDGTGCVGRKVKPFGTAACVHGQLCQFDGAAKQNHGNGCLKQSVRRTDPGTVAAHDVERPGP